MKLTKKQINAFNSVIAMSKTLNKAKHMPIGETKSGAGYEIMSGFMGVIYPESIPEVEKSGQQNDTIRRLIESQITNGNYTLVKEPFSGVDMNITETMKIIRDHTIKVTVDSKQAGVIDLISIEDYFRNELTHYEGRYNAKYLKWAIEMCGKNVSCYMGNTDNKYPPYLYVNSGTFDLNEGIHVIVLPMCKLS